MKTKFFAYFGVLLVIAGCEPPFQPAGMASITTTPQKGIIGNTPPALRQAKNPYDSVGIWHNIILDSLHAYTKKTSDTTKTGIRRYVTTFAKSHWHIELIPDSKLLMPLWNKENRDYKKLLQQQKLSDTGKRLEQELFRAIDSISNLQEFDRFRNNIEEVENKILANTNLPLRERNFLLIMASVAKHSGSYWVDKFGKIPDEIFARGQGKKGLFAKILKWISTVGADVTSAGFCYLEGRRVDYIISDAANMSYLVWGCMTLYWDW